MRTDFPDNMTNAVKYKYTVNATFGVYCEIAFNKPRLGLFKYDHFTKFCIDVSNASNCKGTGMFMVEDWTDTSQPYVYLVGMNAVERSNCIGRKMVDKIIPHLQWITYLIKA